MGKKSEKKDKDKNKALPKKEQISEWYPEVIKRAEIMDYSAVSGCMIIRPYGYAIWENIQKFLDDYIRKIGAKNCYFPLFIPEHLFKKEAEHVEGFSPEVAWVTQGGNTPLKEKLAIRPTSETIMYEAFSRWIRSWRDLPLKINQWVNAVRWEFKHPTPFLRTREFLWQEGHTAFASKQEAEKEVYEMLDIYTKVYEELLAVPVIRGKKSEAEKFAGAEFTLSIEAFLPNKKFAQAATSHHLGRNFSKSFDIKFMTKDEKQEYVWQNSWGLSTRSIGIMIMAHGDDYGLIIPPHVAPIKVVIIPIYNKNTEKEVIKYCEEVQKKLLEIYKDDEVVIDNSQNTPGSKYYEWELRGVPIRIEIGPRELENKEVVIFRRDKRTKENVKFEVLMKEIERTMEEIHKELYERSLKSLRDSLKTVHNKEEFEEEIKKGNPVVACWCGDKEEEKKIKELYEVKTINAPFKEEEKRLKLKFPTAGKCFFCGKKSEQVFIFGKSI